MEQKKKIFLKKFLNVLSYVGIFVFFAMALTCAIFKFQGAKFTIFGNRYDVVLTNSMSAKSEKYKDFLKGHDDQFQAFDLAKSKKVEKAEDLKVYDVVIYKDRTIGTNMHRIVGIEEYGHDTISYLDATSLKLGNYDGIGLSSIGSKIETSDLSFKNFEMTVYTETGSSDSHYNFSILNTSLDYQVSSKDEGRGKLITYKISKESSAPGKLSIAHKSNFDYTKETIVSLKIDAASGEINSTKSDFVFVDNNAAAIYNVDYRFEIRGDKSETSDGYYTFNEIEAKVVGNTPKAGYFIRFLNSIWGGLMFILLGCIILAADIITGVMDKKAKKLAMEGVTTSDQSSSDTKVEEQPKVDEVPKQEEQPKVDEVPKQEEQPKVEEQPMVEEKKSTRWTKDNNPYLNKKRSDSKGEEK